MKWKSLLEKSWGDPGRYKYGCFRIGPSQTCLFNVPSPMAVGLEVHRWLGPHKDGRIQNSEPPVVATVFQPVRPLWQAWTDGRVMVSDGSFIRSCLPSCLTVGKHCQCVCLHMVWETSSVKCHGLDRRFPRWKEVPWMFWQNIGKYLYNLNNLFSL